MTYPLDHSFGADSSNAPFVVRYTSRVRALTSPMLLLLICAAGFYLSATYEPWQEFFGQARSGTVKNQMIIWGTLTALVSLEILMIYAVLLFRRNALVIDAEGLRGVHGWLPRRIAWRDFSHIHLVGDTLQLARKPRGMWETLSQKFTYRGSRRRKEFYIAVPINAVDKSEAEIRAAIQANCLED